MPVLLNSESGMFCELFELNVPKNEESTAIKDFAVHASQFVDHVEVVSATVQYTTNPRNIRVCLFTGPNLLKFSFFMLS